MVERSELFTADECAQVAATVDELRAYWERNSAFSRMFTLGAASYIHAGGKKADAAYHDRARRLTPVLERRFDWMYTRVLAALAIGLDGKVALADGLCPPGFHYYRWDPFVHLLRCGVHLDLQWQSHDFTRYGTPDYERPVSFTIAFRLPKTGAGLNVWNTRKRAEVAGLPMEYVRYGLGQLNLHSGMIFHQIAPMTLEPSEARLTLQGHAIRCDDTWRCYW